MMARHEVRTKKRYHFPCSTVEESMKVFDRFPLFCVLLHAFQATGKTNFGELINREKKPPFPCLHRGIRLAILRASGFQIQCTRKLNF